MTRVYVNRPCRPSLLWYSPLKTTKLLHIDEHVVILDTSNCNLRRVEIDTVANIVGNRK